MNVKSCIEKIEKYFDLKTSNPLLVNVQNTYDMNEIINYFRVEKNKIIYTSDFCHKDYLPSFEKILKKISKENDKCFLLGLTSFFRFNSEEEIEKILKTILDTIIEGQFVILTYQCEKQLKEIVFSDPRLSQKIHFIDGKKSQLPELIFVSDNIDKLALKNEFVLDGIDKVAIEIETGNHQRIYVKTSKSKDMFDKSIYLISDINSPYKVLIKKVPSLYSIDESYGTEDNWNYLLSLIVKYDMDFSEVCNAEFGNYQCLEIFLQNYNEYSENKKWLYFIALKSFYSKCDYLKEVIDSTENHTQFIRNIFRHILNIEPNDKDFQKLYNQRKSLLKQVKDVEDEVVNFCKIILQKEQYAIYYLTDNTLSEKELVFILLEKYFQNVGKDKLESILSTVYPDLHRYLFDYNFNIPLLNEYFPIYKYSKIVNKVSSELEKIVEEQAIKRDYNRYLEPRTSKIDKINTENSEIYFVDAMGVEYLSYILYKCKKYNLTAKITLCTSNLPSITSQNKEFVDYFESKSLRVYKVEELDEVKHNGVKNHDYTNTKQPLHIIRELEIIEKVLEKIKSSLLQKTNKKCIMISDHGSSRMAVIREKENIWEMASKGEHSGRCCLKSDTDICNDFITEENGFWVIANYDRFKGSRKANVEVHGGATLEEVVVPIIEITSIEKNNIEISVITKEITVSFRKKAFVKLFSNIKLEDIKVCVEGKYYDAIAQDDNIYLVNTPDLNKAKTYTMNIYSSENLIAENLEFTIKKESSQERDLF